MENVDRLRPAYSGKWATDICNGGKIGMTVALQSFAFWKWARCLTIGTSPGNSTWTQELNRKVTLPIRLDGAFRFAFGHPNNRCHIVFNSLIFKRESSRIEVC